MMIKSPLTGTDRITLIKTINSSQLKEDWKQIYDIDISNELKECQEIKLYQCNDTKLLFFLPLNITGSKYLYEQLEQFDWYYMPRKWEHDVAIKDLKGTNKVLEVGCGRGSFVKRLKIEHNINAQGIEMNNSAVNYAKKEGVSVSNTDLYELAKDKKNYFDAVCSFQVLEHVDEPLNFLNALIDLIKPNGKLIISVPNADCFAKKTPNNILINLLII